MGYITKNSGKDELIKAIIQVSAGNKYICEEIKNIISDQAMNGEDSSQGFNSLSQRELEIIDLLAKGLSSKEIASQLYISVKTVEVHRYHVLKKLNLKNTASLVDFIHRHRAESA
jgi:two-component system invasion response regulator UvrY